MAREQGLDTDPEATAYATDRLKSKIERGAIYNPVNEMYSGFLSYRALREMQDGGNVVYIDHYRRQESKAKPKAPEPEARARQESSKPDAKIAECMFQRIGYLDAKPRDYLIRGLIPRNEVGNPFGKPDSFKGVTAAQLVVHIAGGVDFLGLEVKQAPTAYFAAERGEQVKRRIKGHLQCLGLPSDLPCYYGERPIDLLCRAVPDRAAAVTC